MYNAELNIYYYYLGERLLSESEMQRINISRNAGVIDEKGILYLLNDGITDKNHEMLVECLKKNGNTDLTTYIKYNAGAKYVAKAVAFNYMSGVSLPFSFVTCSQGDMAIEITPKMAVALFNLYYQFTPFVTTAVIECVEGMGWSKTIKLNNETIAIKNRKTLELEWGRGFDSSEFRNAIQKFQRYA